MLAYPPVVVQLEVCGKWILTAGKSSPIKNCTVLVANAIQLKSNTVGEIAQLTVRVGGITQLEIGGTSRIVLIRLFKNCTPTDPPPPIPFPFPIPPTGPPPF